MPRKVVRRKRVVTYTLIDSDTLVYMQGHGEGVVLANRKGLDSTQTRVHFRDSDMHLVVPTRHLEILQEEN